LRNDVCAEEGSKMGQEVVEDKDSDMDRCLSIRARGHHEKAAKYSGHLQLNLLATTRISSAWVRRIYKAASLSSINSFLDTTHQKHYS